MKKNPYFRKSVSMADRLMACVEYDTNGGCWLWSRAGGPVNYGKIWDPFDRRVKLAHRASYEVFVARPPDELFVCHKCDVPDCINPAHLFLGTHTDNMHDCLAKGRARRSRKLSDSDIDDILDSGEVQQVIADRYGVTQGYISTIKSRGRRSARVWRP